ncbi:uncharacterized protein LOC133815304 [Humulus lupulus]|uniref:uncharacterized protein LOC133815304 n=1 Tax=Humulus lupulus TaxID=3486 RepID=UPI002B408EAD|nr:uncharacterized protein LOC133815304 [Humulus lupulus]
MNLYYVSLCYLFVLNLLVTASAANIAANMNSIPVLNDANFKSCKENSLLVLSCMDLGYALRKEQPASPTEKISVDEKENFEKWGHSNCLSLMMLKRSVLEAFKGSMSDEVFVNDFLKEIEKHFAKNENVETRKLLADLVQMRYKGK